MSVLTNLYGPMGLYAIWIILHFISPIYMFTSVPQQLSSGLSRLLPLVLPPLFCPRLDNIHWRRYDNFLVGYSCGFVRPNPCFQTQKCSCSLSDYSLFLQDLYFHKIENLLSKIYKKHKYKNL